jgi:hypothetical protein
MKKASISLVCILAVVLVVGMACGGITPCSICGKYVSPEHPYQYIQLDSDGTCRTQSDHGTWEQDGNVIILNLTTSKPSTYILEGNELRRATPPGTVYVKE